jgi:hypothetical protein
MEFPWLSLTLFMLLFTGLLVAADLGGQATGGDSSLVAFAQHAGLDTAALADTWARSRVWLEDVWEHIKEWLLAMAAHIRDWFEEGKFHEALETLQDHIAAATETIR